MPRIDCVHSCLVYTPKHFPPSQENTMRTIEKDGRMTRRDFFAGSGRVFAGAGLLATANSANAANVRALETVNSGSGPMLGKIALEEHFVIPETLSASYGAPGGPEFQRQLEDIGSARIADMDRGGLDVCILSLVGPGIQGIPDVSQAISIARRANDHLAEQIAKNPKRFRGFAALPLQDPQAAAKELTRCVRELGFCGALVSGWSQIATPDSIAYYDAPRYRDFWATV